MTDIDNITPAPPQKKIFSELQKFNTQLGKQESISHAELESIKSEMKTISDLKYLFEKQ